MVADQMSENWKQKWSSTYTEPHDKKWGARLPQAPGSDAYDADDDDFDSWLLTFLT